MEQKYLFDVEGRASEGDESKGMIGKFGSSQKGDAKVLLLVLLLIVGAYAGYVFYLKKEEPAAPPPPAPVKMPIKGAPVMANVTGVKAAQVKETAKAEEKKEKAEAEKPAEVKVSKKEEAAKPKPEVKVEKSAQKEAAQAELKKAEAKVEAEAKKPAEEKIAQKKEVKEAKEKTAEKIGKERHVVVVGTYAAKYAAEEAREKLKGKGIRSSSREVKKRLAMSRIFIKEVKKKEEATALLSELKGKGYEPFSVLDNGVYKIYAVSNMNEDIAGENKADLEKLGYQPVIEKKVVNAKVYELIAGAKSAKEAKTLSAKLKKIGFKPEIRN